MTPTVYCLLSHLLQILLEHLHHGLQLSYLPLKPYVTLTVKKKQTKITFSYIRPQNSVQNLERA